MSKLIKSEQLETKILPPIKNYIDTEVGKKQPTLVSGTNIKTVNGNSLLGSGDISITGGAEFEITASSDSASLGQGNDYLGVDLSDANGPTLTLTQPGTYVKSKTLATKDYVDSKDNIFYFRETKTGGVVTYSMTFAELKAMYDAKKQGIFVGSGQNVFPFLSFNYFGPADAGGERILFKAEIGSNRPDVRVFTVLPDDTVTYETINESGVHFAVDKETWYGTYTDENDVTYQVYTKTVFIPALPSAAGITTYPIGVTNMKQIISISGVTTDGFVLNAPRQTASDNIAIYQVSKGSQTFSIEVGKDRSSKSAYVTIIYAKNN